MKESTLVLKIMNAVKKAYPKAYVRKLSDRFNRGIPDILIVFTRWREPQLERPETGVLFVEAKTPTGRLSKVQALEQEQIRAAASIGCRAIVALTVEEVLFCLQLMRAVP